MQIFAPFFEFLKIQHGHFFFAMRCTSFHDLFALSVWLLLSAFTIQHGSAKEKYIFSNHHRQLPMSFIKLNSITCQKMEYFTKRTPTAD